MIAAGRSDAASLMIPGFEATRKYQSVAGDGSIEDAAGGG
jgi:hypothetical protein